MTEATLACSCANKALILKHLIIYLSLAKPHGMRGFPGDSDSEESACNAGDSGSIPGLGRSPGEGNGNPLQYSCLENPHIERSLVGCSPWGRRVDMTEQLTHLWHDPSFFF